MDKSKLRQYARELRKNGTDAERCLWYHLRAGRMGCKFKRQMPVERFIVDFICFEKHLIIELDGGQHQEQQTYDASRSTFLRQRGFRMLRFWNHDVLQRTSAVLEVIVQALSPTLSREIAQ